jgi:hypothetical protein
MPSFDEKVKNSSAGFDKVGIWDIVFGVGWWREWKEPRLKAVGVREDAQRRRETR